MPTSSIQQTTGAIDQASPPQWEVTRPINVIPVLSDGSPDEVHRSEGVTTHLTRDGVGFLLPSDVTFSRRLVVGIEADAGDMQFATVELLDVSELPGMNRYEASILSGDDDPLAEANLCPRLNPDNYQLELGLPFETLEAWERAHVLRRVVTGRGLVCPDCQAMPLVRNGCKACGSARLTSCRLIHHFACAHVDHLSAFQNDPGIVCPKCRAHSLIAGTDFEYLRGPYQCHDCNWSDTDFETVGHCLHCDLQFPLHQATEVDFVGFQLSRLDPVACLDAS